METFDAIVVGLGAHGSAAAAALVRRGQRVLGLERFGRGETFGSSGGRSRMIRFAYFEGATYVPLAIASWEQWRALEAETGAVVLERTGGLYGGPADSRLVAGAIRTARELGLAHEVIDAEEIHRRWPLFEPAPETVALVEERAGELQADRANAAHLAVAEMGGAELRFGRRVVDWRAVAGGGFEVEDGEGVVVGAAHLVLTAGPWVGPLVADLGLPLVVEREAVAWFRPTLDPASIAADRLPVWLLHDGDETFYGFRHDPEHGLKVAIHHQGVAVDPDEVDRWAGARDIDRVRGFLRRRLPAADGALAGSTVCLYTNTPDEAFVIDRHPVAAGVAFASACSGHGFKFAPLVGEILADLVTDGSTPWPISAFRADRFTQEVAGQPGAS